jgi:nucleolar protein 58
MARMVATKAALSIRVDALTDVEGKSDPLAPSIGLENRAKLEYRLRKLEEESDQSGVRRFDSTKKQKKFEMQGDLKVYNTAADAVDLVPSQREPQEVAVRAVLDVKEERRREKEAKKAKKRAEKEAKIEVDVDEENTDDVSTMDVDGEQEKSKNGKDKKRKRRESEPTTADAEPKVSQCLVKLDNVVSQTFFP